jgi:2-methylcitrate dehydratase PrpD
MVEDRRRQSADAVSRLLESAAAVDPSGVPPKVRARAALVLCDDLAAMVAASGEAEVAAARQAFAASSAGREATVFAAGIPGSCTSQKQHRTGARRRSRRR